VQEGVTLILLAVVGAVLVDSGMAKLGKARPVKVALLRQGLPLWLAKRAGVLPLAELVLASSLVLPPTRTLGAALAALTFITFAVYLTWLWAFRPGESCQCFGDSSAVTPWHVILDLMLGTGAVALAAASAAMEPEVSAAVAGTAIAAGAVGCRAWRTRTDRRTPAGSSHGVV